MTLRQAERSVAIAVWLMITRMTKKLGRPKAKDLTMKQRKWVNEYMRTGNATQSAMKVYRCKNLNTASTIGSQNLTKLNIPLSKLMDSMGLSKGKLINKINDKLESKKIHGTSDDFIEVDDNPSQLKAVEIAGKWLGVDKGSTVNVQVNVPILGGKSNLDSIDD